MKYRVGIVGCGYTVGIANNHVRGWSRHSDECELVAFYDIVPRRAEEWTKAKGLNVTICNSFDELIDMCDIVSICTPNYAHVDMVCRALEKGKHVLCEKPLSVDYESCQPAVLLSKSTSLITMVGFSYRGIPALRLMKKYIEDGKMGEIFTWRETLGGCRIANPEVKLEWRMQKDLSGTGALADFGCHMIDLCDWILSGSAGTISSVQGMKNTSIKERTKIFEHGIGCVTNDDSAAFNIQFSKGTIASFVASRLGVKRHTIEVYGEGGMMLFNDEKPNELEVWFKDKNGGYQGKSEIIVAPEDLITEPWADEEYGVFLNAIKTGIKPERSIERAAYLQAVLDAIEESTECGETIVL